MNKKSKTPHFFEYNGVTYLIERDHRSIGYNTFKVVWNLDGTPRCRTGWVWYRGNQTQNENCAMFATTLANAKAAIQGRETGDICFA